MKSKTLLYAALAVALGITGTVVANKIIGNGIEAAGDKGIKVANKIIGNGYKDDPAACEDVTAGSNCEQSTVSKTGQQPTPAKPAAAAMTATKPN